jgi:acetylornithine deacetylase/succinyl-diaminopimelate desuccinylase-like protein
LYRHSPAFAILNPFHHPTTVVDRFTAYKPCLFVSWIVLPTTLRSQATRAIFSLQAAPLWYNASSSVRSHAGWKRASSPPMAQSETAREERGLSMLDELLRDASVVRAFAAIEAHHEDLVQLIIRLCEIAAPTFAERPRAQAVAEQLQALGLHNVHVDETNNVIGVLSGREAGPTMLLDAHTDTVFPAGTDVRVRREDGKLKAPGVGDDSANLACGLFLLRLVRDCGLPLPGTLIFSGTAGEEGLGDLCGIKAVMQELAGRVDYVLALDGQLGRICNQGVGSHRYQLAVKAQGGHSWADFGSPSAIHALGATIARIAQIEVPKQPRTTFNVGMISGGTSVNTIAESATMLLDMRSVSAEELANLEDRVLAILPEVARDYHVQIERQLVGDRPAGSKADTAWMVDTIRQAHESLGIQTQINAASTNANVPLSQGIPAAVIGTYTGKGTHRLDEWIDERSVILGMKQLVLAVLALQRRATLLSAR